MKASELVLIKLKDISQQDSVTDALTERIESQINIFSGYAPDQTALLEDSVIDVQGNYILYVTGEDAEAVDEEFRKSL